MRDASVMQCTRSVTPRSVGRRDERGGRGRAKPLETADFVVVVNSANNVAQASKKPKLDEMHKLREVFVCCTSKNIYILYEYIVVFSQHKT